MDFFRPTSFAHRVGHGFIQRNKRVNLGMGGALLRPTMFAVPQVIGSFALVASLLITGTTRAQADRSIQQRLKQAASTFDPESLPVIATQQAAWLSAASETRAFFESPNNRDVSAAWLGFLKLETLEEAIRSDASIGKKGLAAEDLARRLTGLNEGLELTALIRLRDETLRFIDALRFGDARRSRRVLETRLKAVAENWSASMSNEVDWNPSAEFDDRLATLVRNLLGSGQHRELVDAIQQHYSAPNLSFSVSQEAVSTLTSRAIDDQAPVQECILGSRIVGTSRLMGGVRSQLLPGDGLVRLLLRMDAKFTTQSRGYQKPVSVDSTASTDVYVARQVAVTERRPHLGPAVAVVDLKSRLQRVNHPLKLVRKIAMKKAREAKPKVEAISSSRLEKRLVDDFERRSAEALDRTFPSLDETLGPWLKRLNLSPISRHLSSRPTEARMVATITRPDALNAPNPSPPVSAIAPDYQFAIQVHESVATTVAAQLLSGETVSPAMVDQIADRLGVQRSVAPENESESPVSDFEVDFATSRPAFFEARDQTLRLGFRATRFASEERELPRSMQVVATYRPVEVNGGMQMVRDQEIEISFPGNRRLSIPQTAIKANMEKILMDVFPTQLLHRSWTVPSDASTRMVAGKTFRVEHIDLQSGWITVALKMVDAPEMASMATNP